MAYEVRVKVKGISDYLQHKRPFEEDTSRHPTMPCQTLPHFTLI